MNAPGSFPVRCHNPVAADIDVTDNCFCTVFFAGLYLSSSFNKTAIIFHKNNEVFVNCDMYLQCRRFASTHVPKCDLGLFVDLLEFSEDRSPWESVEEKLTAIR